MTTSAPVTDPTATTTGSTHPKRAPWTLRRRLMVVVVGLLALGSAVVGVASAVAVSSIGSPARLTS